ncbi:glyoxylate/hydroxypyruvate reductase A [uncultured Roseobacter sp.]|uniref:2-hydroxyacid dehydrogenase n=1 Tax=uncultured Roseobacter sp. TaxID=114847 RepID=UPI0026321B18|nr:glyoxylate/hydroxypyruvate reductase A [uncultured Roseobacter sp.]
MPLNVLFAATEDRWSTYEPTLLAAFRDAGLDARLALDIPPQDVDYIVYAPNSELQDFTPYTRTKAVLNLWAGVEAIVGNKTLTQPLARMVDPGMTRSMTEWVTGHVLRHHLGMDRHILDQSGAWEPVVPPLAEERRVCILGLGALGTSVARTLVSLGFDVSGWSRSPKSIPGIDTFHGDTGLDAELCRAEILVLLLPDTPATENTLDARRLSLMPKGAFIINPGRGPLIDDDALIGALDNGSIAHATLDVFRVEPLPVEHPFWAHPRITVTPHIAAETRARTASEVIAENIRRGEAGEPFVNLVDRERGY